ncbi:MAG: FAD-binding oxidoreductase [Rhodospirillales bacterium]|nr:FAD-binding oxidoreductase [Rhodospirillales bacterium]
MASPARTLSPADALDRIKAAVGPKGLIGDPADMTPHLVEQRGIYRGKAALVVRPASTAEIAQVVAICAEAGLAIVPQGGNTGLVGGGVPHEHGGEILLSLSRMNRIRAIDPLNDTIIVEAGCILANIQKAAAEADRLFPLSLAAEGTCQIGGNLSTNAGGVQVLRYGMARDLVLGLEVVLPDGRIWEGLSGLRKDNTGYDLKQLFLGAEGTLGVIAAAVLRLFPRPREVETVFCAIRDPQAAIELLARARAGIGDAVTAIELISDTALGMVLAHVPGTAHPLAARHPWCVLMEASGGDTGGALRRGLERVLAAALEDGLVADATIAASTQQARALWRLREAISEAQKPEGASIKHDVSVPVSAVPAFIAEATAACERALPGVRVVAFGHAGDGNIHFNLSQPKGADGPAFAADRDRFNRIVHDIVAGHGGSISAEHGIGRLKRAELAHYAPAVKIDLMRALKHTLDPQNIMNPGKVIP